MVRQFSEIEEIVRKVIRLVSESSPVQAAYLFGSYAAGNPRDDSDIDIAIFADGVDEMGAEERIVLITKIQKQFDAEIELHLFSSDMLKEERPSNFFGYIIAHGKEIAA